VLLLSLAGPSFRRRKRSAKHPAALAGEERVLGAVLRTGFAEGAVAVERIKVTIFLLEWQLSSTCGFVNYWSELGDVWEAGC